MAASKRKKQIKQKRLQKGEVLFWVETQQQYIPKIVSEFPSSDQEKWPFTQEHIGDSIWEEILPRLKALEETDME